MSKPSPVSPTIRHAWPRGYAIDMVLQCSRGIAALWVFMFHIPDLIGPTSPTWAQLASYGHYGVALFFAISGYCMYASAQSVIAKGHTPADFMRRRLVRVMPPFWLSILAVMAVPFVIALVSLAKSGRYDWPQAPWMAYSGADWIQIATLTRALFHPDMAGQAAFTHINAVYWTLAIELQFYLVMAVALALRTHWQRVVVVVTGISLISLVWHLANSAVFLQYWPAFALGMALRLAHVRGATPARVFGQWELPIALAGALLLLGAIAAAMLAPLALVGAGTALADWDFTVAALLSVVLLWLLGGVEHGAGEQAARSGTAAAGRWVRRALLPAILLGQCSYSLYLIHGKLYQLPAMFVRQLVPAHSWLAPALTIGATALLCYGFYLVAERPFQHGKPVRARPGAALKTMPA